MFRIRERQQDALADKAFIDRAEEHIAESLLDRRTTAEERARLPIRAMVVHGIEVARGYGLSTQRDLLLFVLNMVTINPDWHRQPHIQRILQDGSLTPPERREKLLTDVSDDEWEEAAAMTDANRYWADALPAD